MSMSFIILYITYKNLDEAQKTTSHLLAKKLIACANFFPIKSSYLWKDKIENSEEIVLLLKTRKENWKKIRSEVVKLHPYKTPCIIKIDAEANEEYASWINDATKQSPAKSS